MVPQVLLPGSTRLYKVLQVVKQVLQDTARYYKWYLQDTMRYYEWYYESLWGITRNLRHIKCFFRGILPKVLFQKRRYEKFLQNSLEVNCERILALVKLQPYVNSFTK